MAAMPADVLFALASSGLTVIASLVFFVSVEAPPSERRSEVLRYCLPPVRACAPPPLPQVSCCFGLTLPTLVARLTLRPSGGEWLLTLTAVPLADAPAARIGPGTPAGFVNDLRWHGRAGVQSPTQRCWKVKPGRA
jgi:hypothetical protein